MIHSYPSVYQIGHKAIPNLFEGVVSVQEKIDGSQFSFGIIDGELQARSKNKQLIINAPEKMFARAIETVLSLSLSPGIVYRGEYLEKPKHNTIVYSRVPDKHIILFDISQPEGEAYLERRALEIEAKHVGLELVPEFFRGEIKTMEEFKGLLDRESVLGGAKMEGVS